MHKRMEGTKCPAGDGVHISKELWAFAVAEFVEIHHLLDLCDVPRVLNGEKQSAAQRVKYYVGWIEQRAAMDVRAEGRMN